MISAEELRKIQNESITDVVQKQLKEIEEKLNLAAKGTYGIGNKSITYYGKLYPATIATLSQKGYSTKTIDWDDQQENRSGTTTTISW